MNKELDISEEEVQHIINEVDYFGNHKINYSEFLVATIDLDEFMNEKKLMAIFN